MNVENICSSTHATPKHIIGLNGGPSLSIIGGFPALRQQRRRVSLDRDSAVFFSHQSALHIRTSFKRCGRFHYLWIPLCELLSQSVHSLVHIAIIVQNRIKEARIALKECEFLLRRGESAVNLLRGFSASSFEPLLQCRESSRRRHKDAVTIDAQVLDLDSSRIMDLEKTDLLSLDHILNGLERRSI